MSKAIILFLVPGFLFVQGFAPVSEEINEDEDAEVDRALQPFWDLLLAKVTLFSETWSQRIKEVMRSLAYPKGYHHKCVDHHHSYRMAEAEGEEAHHDEGLDAPTHHEDQELDHDDHDDRDHDANDDAYEPDPVGEQPENSQGE